MKSSAKRSRTSPNGKARAVKNEFLPGKGAAGLEKNVRALAVSKRWDVTQPTTREIGDRYDISNATVCRLLARLSEEGVIWRRDNGRYYLNDSRRVLELHKPYACLLRKVQNWSRVYQSVMSGVSHAFGQDPASMLFVHNETLVRHADTRQPPVHAGAAEQRQALAEFFRVHGGGFRGILLDEIWNDEVLREFSDLLTNSVVVCRPTTLPEVSSVATDFEAAGLLAIGHLYARGFEEIWLAAPFVGSAAIDHLAAAAARAGAALGSKIEAANICSVATPADRARFISRLRAAKGRVGVFSLEDNMTLILQQAMKAAALECPRRVGLLSGMGTDLVTGRHISSVQIDYERIGRAAGEILVSGKPARISIRPQLVTGATT